jgi:chromate transport protein ChrA
MTLYISKGLFALESNDNFRTAANIITCSAFIAAIGVFFGIFESLAGNTTFFIQKMDFDYPYSNGLDETTLVNGFFASANSSAYALGAGLAFIKFQNLCRNNFKLYLYMFLFIALMITKTKFVFLIAATYLGFIFLKNTSRKLLVFYLLLLGMSYLFLSHIMIAASGTYDYPSLHYRKRLFSIGSIDFILGAYGMLKVYAFEAITANILLPNGLENFVTTYGGRPHFMFGALIISGGISTAILVFTYIYSLIKNKWDEALKGLDDNQVYLTILFCFIIETLNWNFTNNFYFWSVVMGLGFINKYKNI